MIQEWLHVITDPAHIMGELTFASVEFLVGLVVGSRWLRRHDRKHHTQT